MKKKEQTIAEAAEAIKRAYLHGYTCEPGLPAAIACASEMKIRVEDYYYNKKSGAAFTLLTCKMQNGKEFVVDPEEGTI